MQNAWFVTFIPVQGENIMSKNINWLLTPQGHKLLPEVAYPGEIDSVQYDTPGRLTHQDIIPQGDFEKFE